MELALKLPKGKPPFIGIVFESSFEASRLNAHLVEVDQPDSFTIQLEVGGSLNLRLIGNETNFYYQYLNLKYDREKLKTWLHHTQKAKRFNFSHLIRNYDKLKVVTTPEKMRLFVLKIDEVNIPLY